MALSVTVREQYNEYVLVVHLTTVGVLVGVISASESVERPANLPWLHGGSVDLEQWPEYKEIYGIPMDHWCYRFCCNHQDDVNVVNETVTADFSTWRPSRVWTVRAVFDHLKECIDS